MTDYLIIGQGLAGSILADHLLRNRHTVHVLNNESLPTSSLVAGGLYNPITGKDLSKTWLADSLFPYMNHYFSALENEFNCKLLYETNIFRPFVNQNQKNQFLELIKKQQIDDYIQYIEKPNHHPEIHSPIGGLLTLGAGWIDIPLLLQKFREKFISLEAYSEENFDESEMQLADNEVVYKNFVAKNIIFCQGFYATQNPLFSWLRFNPVKGETLIAKVENYGLKEIVNQGAWILPMQQTLCRFGASYTWKSLDWLPSQEEKENLLSKIDKFLRRNYEITDHQAGVRPATQDRRPFLGRHPAYSNVFVFNGLGTKGVSLAPYLANEMVGFMENKKVLSAEVNIERYYSLYSLQRG